MNSAFNYSSSELSLLHLLAFVFDLAKAVASILFSLYYKRPWPLSFPGVA